MASESSVASVPSARSSTSSEDSFKSASSQDLSTSESSDDTSYNFNHPQRGIAVVINNECFHEKSMADRHGSSLDAVSLKNTFQNLGFEVIEHTNLTASEMLENLTEVAKTYNHSQADCFVCAVLTHGDEGLTQKAQEDLKVREDILFGTDGKPVKTKALVDLFSDSDCPGLKGKPRLFFLQACRGTKLDPGQLVNVSLSKASAQHTMQSASMVDKPDKDHLGDVDRIDANPVKIETEAGAEGGPADCDKTDTRSQRSIRNITVSPVPLHKDFLIMYATPPGYYAWRRNDGSWFVQSLCRVLCSTRVPDTPLLSLLQQVTGIVAREYQSQSPSDPKMHQKKECPVIESMLVKDIYLTKKNAHQT